MKFYIGEKMNVKREKVLNTMKIQEKDEIVLYIRLKQKINQKISQSKKLK